MGGIVMKTIKERASLAAWQIFEETILSEHSVERVSEIIEEQIREQKHLTLEAFDEWLCRNSWITRDEGNLRPLKELRNIIQNI